MVYKTKFKDLNSKIIGYDTETFNGKVTLIANSDGEYLIPYSLEELLTFLTAKRQNVLRFFFNMEYDVNAIIKWLPKENIEEIAFYNKTTINDFDNRIQYVLHNIRRKLFCIEKRRYSDDNEILNELKFKFFDISQFYQIGSLEKTHAKIFPERPYKKSLDASKEFPQYKITQEDIDYCIADSIACKELSEHFVNTTRKIIPVKNFYSPASLGKCLLSMNMIKPYKFKYSEIQKTALLSYNGGRFETMKIGKAEKVYQYDINSAYPHALSLIPDIEGYKDYSPEYLESATHSFFIVDFEITKGYISPIRYESNNLLMYPIGIFKDYPITKKEYELLIKLGVKVKIKKAYHILNDEPTYPFKFLIDIYNKRKEYKKSKDPALNSLQLPLKLSMNSIYGIMIQTTKKYEEVKFFNNEDDEMNEDNVFFARCRQCQKDYTYHNQNFKGVCDCGSKVFDEMILRPSYNAGNFFNPIIAAEITANVRCRLYEDSLKYADNLYMYATDSITVDKKIPLKISDELGDYSKTEPLNGVIFGSGIYSLHNDKEHKVRFRGFNQKDTLQIAKNNLKESVYEEKIRRPIKLKEALIQKEMGIDNINVFKTFEKDFKLNFDVKRLWDRKAIDFNDILNNVIDSRPKNIQCHL